MPFDQDGRPLALSDRLGRGGEGEVFAVAGDPALAVKVLAPAHRAGKEAKLRAMLANAPAGAHDPVEGFPVLTWPRALVYGDARRRPHDLLGYAMARIQPAGFVPWHQVTGAARRQGLGGQALTFDKLVLLGLRLAHVVRTLHRLGYAVGDLNDRNVLVSRRLTPLLMDTDSFQVPDGRRTHPCTVGDALYWPPELLDVDLARRPVDRTASDQHALGVLLFQLFLGGLRPYQARGALVAGLESLQEKTRAGHYPWARPRPGVLEPPAGAPAYAALPKPLRQAFERCFVDGHRHPRRRPTADDWVRVLSAVREGGYQACRAEARHVFAAGERRCPWCADPNDPFTGPAHRPRPVAAPPPRRVVVPPPKHKARPKGPPQRALAAPPRALAASKPRAGRAAPTAGQAMAAAPRQRARPAVRVRPAAPGRVRTRKRRAAHAWPPKARWMAAFTTVLLAAWWVTS